MERGVGVAGLEVAFKECLAGLPWADEVRLLVGPLCSRESIKNILLDRVEVLPETAVCTLSTFAQEILRFIPNRGSFRPLSPASQCDALERLAKADFLREVAPGLCSHLRARPVAQKVARFVTELDRFYVHEADLEALVEYFEAKDPNLGAFLRVLSMLWQKGELYPWGEGDALRKAIALLVNGDVSHLPTMRARRLWLYGFSEFTPLEEAFLSAIKEAGTELVFLTPAATASFFESGCERAGVALWPMQNPAPERALWHCHSAWDELEFLRDELVKLRDRGVGWSEIAVLVPKDSGYKRFCRQKLHSWNVPLQDPTLPDDWKDVPHAIWWRDLFRVVASGLKVDEVRAWLGPGDDREAMFRETYLRGITGAASQWTRIIEKFPSPDIKLLIDATGIFSRAMSPLEFRDACEKLVALTDRDGELIREFAQHLVEERPYLEGFRGRLPRYVPLFEEFLAARARMRSLRCRDGVVFTGHGVFVPGRARHAFALGVNTIERARPSADAWEWEGIEVRKAWQMLHFGLSWEERVRRDEALLETAMLNHGHVTISSLDYGLGGDPLVETPLSKRLAGDAPCLASGGHPAAGWIEQERRNLAVITEHELHPELSPDTAHKPVAVSAFEEYLRCPYRYYARHILKLFQEEELGLDPNHLARGQILHRVLERVLRAEIEGEQEWSGIDAARQAAFSYVDDELKKATLSGGSVPGLYRHEALLVKAGALMKSQINGWLDWEFARRAQHPSLRPLQVEFPIELELEAGFRLHGKADRVDSDGAHCVVIDYKSGTPPFIGRELVAGLGAQLLMYSGGVAERLKLEPAGAFYLSVGRRVDGSKGIFLKNKKG